MTTTKQIFNYISGVNPSVSCISSIGNYVSHAARSLANDLLKEVIISLPKTSLAYKIIMSSTALNNNFSDKQLWVMAYELEKNEVFVKIVIDFFAKIDAKAAAKANASKAKLAANKEASADVLQAIKAAGKKLGDYYKWLNVSGNNFRKEFFSKKYSEASVSMFLSV